MLGERVLTLLYTCITCLVLLLC